MTTARDIENLETDIPLEAARAAHAGTSHDPERRAEQERQGYAATLAADFAALAKLAGTGAQRARLIEEFTRYRQGLRARTLAHLAAKSRCLSTMIAGPSNFPTARAARANVQEHRRLEELLAYRTRVLAAIRRVLQPELRPIMAGDDDATERLRAKLAKAEQFQACMKAANAAIRAHAKAGADAQVAALVALGFKEPIARRLLEPDFAGKVGFADYQLTNNGAEIRRIKARLVGVEHAKAAPTTEVEGANARIEDCPGENRVRLFCPGKPSAEVRGRLKAAGFRWTPTLGCWQAYRNPRALEIAEVEAGAGSAAPPVEAP